MSHRIPLPQTPTTPAEDAAELAAHVHDRQRQTIATKEREIENLREANDILTRELRLVRHASEEFRKLHRHALGLTCEFPACAQRITVSTNLPTHESGIGAPHVNGLVGAASAMRWRIGPGTAAELEAFGERVWSTGIADLCPNHNGATTADLDRKPT